ncbi:MAG: aldehyde dehydrogenase family protein [Micrococcus sp.]|nr:aldehyde dehydrogenase family protein [Micrococcus sp.]
MTLSPAAALALQRAAVHREGAPSIRLRRDRLDRLTLLLTRHADAIAAAVAEDFGTRPAGVGLMTDVLGPLPDIALLRARCRAWTAPRPVRGSSLMALPTWVERVPLGVVGVMGPWNVPVTLTLQPAAAAIAAGNRVVIKPSEHTPATAALLAELVPQHFDAEELAVVTGDAEVAADFAAQPWDHLFFTGSTRIGAKVAEAAGTNLVPVTLELGGKNPAVLSPQILADDVPRAAARLMAGRLMNGGQICVCPDEVYVPREHLPAFLAAAREAATVSPIGLIHDAHLERVVGLVADAVRSGAKLHRRGHAPVTGATSAEDRSWVDRRTRVIEPLILTDVSAEMEIDTEEVFGPVLTVHAYDDVADVIERQVPRPAPLAASWFGPEGDAFAEFCRRVSCGAITVDDVATHLTVPNAPFGGVGASGTGAYHGRAGVERLSHARTVTRSRAPFSAGAALSTPSALTTTALRAGLRATGAGVAASRRVTGWLRG